MTTNSSEHQLSVALLQREFLLEQKLGLNILLCASANEGSSDSSMVKMIPSSCSASHSTLILADFENRV